MSFSNRFGKGLLASMESEQDVVEEVLDTAENVEADLGEAAEIAGDIDDGIAAMDQGEADADALNSIADTLEETEQDGGADPVAARVAEVAVEAIYARLGITRKPVSSMEAFGDKATRVEATKLSVEGIREVVRSVWEAVKKVLLQVKEWIMKFVDSIFNAQTKLQKRAEGVLAKAESLSGAPAEAEVSGSFIKELAANDKFTKEQALKTIASLNDYASGAQAFIQTAVFAEKNLAVEEAVKDKASFDAQKQDFKNPKGKKSAEIGGEKAPEGFSWWTLSPEASGAQKVCVTLPNKALTGEAAYTAFATMKVKLVSTNTKIDVSNAKAPTLSPDEIKSIANSVIESAKAFEANKTTTKEMVKSLDDLASKATKTSTIVVNDESKEAAARAKIVARAVTNLGKLLSSVSTSMLKHSAQLSQAGLAYAEKSMGAYKKADKAAEAK